eukprot:scaffold52030_cov15-Tisochrysis_lutea.AAC.1
MKATALNLTASRHSSFLTIIRVLTMDLVVVCDADAAKEITQQKVCMAQVCLFCYSVCVVRLIAVEIKVANCLSSMQAALTVLPLPRVFGMSHPFDLLSSSPPSQNYPKSPTYDTLHPFIGAKSMVCSEGKVWSKQRKAFAPGFQFAAPDSVMAM